MYSHNMNNDDKQNIVNSLESMNFFNNIEDNTVPKHNYFYSKLFKQLKNNFPHLTKNITLDDMEYIVTHFNLSKQNYINKNNIKKLINFLKIHEKLKQEEKIQFEKQIEQQIQQKQIQQKQNSYEEITNAIDFFNQITTTQNNTNNNTINKNNDISKVTNIAQSKKDDKIDFETLLQQRQLEHQQLLQSQMQQQPNRNKNLNNTNNNIKKNDSNQRLQNNNSQVDILNDQLEQQRKQFKLELEKNKETKSNDSNSNSNSNSTITFQNNLELNKRVSDLQKMKMKIPSLHNEKENIKMRLVDNNLQTKIHNVDNIKQKKYTISINSQDRNKEFFKNPNHFEFTNENSNISFQNIIKVKLDNIILPKYSNIEGDLDNFPYLLLEIKELGSNYNGSNEYLNKAFAKLILDNEFGKYKSIKNCNINKEFNPPINLSKITIVIRKPNGELYDFGTNIINYDKDDEAKYNDPTTKNIVLYGDTKQKNTIPEINLDLEITYLVKEIGTHYTI